MKIEDYVGLLKLEDSVGTLYLSVKENIYSKTYLGSKAILYKYIGGKKVLKEILNGATIYERN